MRLSASLGFLAPDDTRTATLECVDEAVVLRISYDQMKQLYFQNPKFGFYLMRLASQRLFREIAGRGAHSSTGGPTIRRQRDILAPRCRAQVIRVRTDR